MGTLSRGWQMAKASFKVLRSDKEIMLLPVASAGVCILVLLTILGIPVGFGLLSFQDAWPIIILFYFVSSFVVVFFNTAVVACAKIRFEGGDPTVRQGLSVAWSRVGRIIEWSIVAATVGIVLRSVRRKGGLVGTIISYLGGLAWAVATYFVLPVIIYEDLGPFAAVKRSIQIIRKTWGEGVTAYISTHVIFFLLGLVGLPFLLLGIWSLGFSAALGIFLIALAMAYFVLLAVAGTAVDGILTAALYKFSVDGKVPGEFEGARIEGVIY